MTERPTDAELIRLVQETAPEDLTPEQIEQLRQRLRESPELREVLIGQLHLESYLTQALSEFQVPVDSILQRAAALERPSRGGWPLRVGFALGLLLLVSAVWYAVARRGGDDAEILVARKGADRPEATAPENDAPSKPQADAPAAADEAPPKPPEPMTVAEQTRAPQPAAPVPMPPTVAKPVPWAAALDPQTPPRPVGETAFAVEAVPHDLPPKMLGEWFEAVPGQPHHIHERQMRRGRFAAVEGLSRLRAPWPADAVLRLGLFEPDHLKIHLWNGNEGVSLHWLAHTQPNVWAAYRATREGTDLRPKTLTLLASDEGRHERTEAGPFELRHQDGTLVMSRGDVRLLTVPLAMPPMEVLFEGKTWVSEIALFRGESLPPEPVNPRPAILAADQPARLPWYRPAHANPPRDRQSFPLPVPARADVLPGIALIGHSMGPIELSTETPLPNGSEPILVCTDLPRPGLYEIIAQIDEATPGSGLYLGDVAGQPICQIGFLRDRRTGWTVVAPLRPNERHTEIDVNPDHAPAAYVAPGQWVRAVLGFGSLKLWTSGDGRHWSRAMHGPMHNLPHVVTCVGLTVLHDKEPRHIRLRHLEVREMTGLTALADDDLRAQVPDFGPMGRLSHDAWLAKVIESRPAGVGMSRWRRACAVRGLENNPWTSDTAQLLRGLVGDALDPSVETGAALRFLEDLVLLADTWGGDRARALMQHYETLGRTLARRSEPDAFGRVARAWIEAPLWTSGPLSPFTLEYAADLLVRSVFAPDPAATLGIYRRVRAWMEPAQPDRAWEYQDKGRTRLFDWGASAAAQALPASEREPLALSGQRWRHPLLSQLNKEGYNVMAEFEAALAGQAWEDACQIIAAAGAADDDGRSAALGLLPDAKEPGLLVSLPRAVELAMRDHPELPQTMQNRFGQIGQLRARQAMAAGDPDAVEAATVQFYGTEAAAEAHAWLGDRALAAGKFAQAASQYREALRTAGLATAHEITARRQLAEAILGEPPAEPPQTAVTIGGVTLAPGEFQSLLSDLNAKRAKSGEPTGSTATEHGQAPKPAAYDTPVRGRFEGDLGNNPGRGATADPDWVARQLAVATDAERMYVSNRFQVTAYDLKTAQQKWSQQLGGEHGEAHDWRFVPMQPLVSGRRLYVRRLTKNGPELACLDATDGKVLWRNRPENHVASDPVFAHDRLMALIATAPQAGIVQLDIASFHPETGDVLSQRTLLRLSDTWNQRVPCAAAAAEGKIVAAVAGSIVCCDALGRPQWLRQQPWMPDEIDRQRPLQSVQPPRLADGRVYVAQPGVKAIICLELETGRQFWNRPLPNVRRLLGLLDGRLVVQTDDGLLALDAETGDPQWRHATGDLLDGYLLGGEGGLVAVRRIDLASKQRHPALVWLDPATGRATASAPLPDLIDDTPQLGPLVHAGDKLWAFFGKDYKQAHREIVELVPRNEPPAGPLDDPLLADWLPEPLPRTLVNTATVLPGWTLLTPQPFPGPVRGAELRPEVRGERRVLVTRTFNNQPVRLARRLDVPSDGRPRLALRVGLESGQPWTLTVHVDGTEALRAPIDDASTRNGWRSVEVDLQPYAGRTVWLTLTQTDEARKKPIDAFWKTADLVK